MVHGANYHDEANEKIISLAMIETVEALENVEKIAATGVNFISSGWITHSSKSLDIGLDLIKN